MILMAPPIFRAKYCEMISDSFIDYLKNTNMVQDIEQAKASAARIAELAKEAEKILAEMTEEKKEPERWIFNHHGGEIYGDEAELQDCVVTWPSREYAEAAMALAQLVTKMHEVNGRQFLNHCIYQLNGNWRCEVRLIANNWPLMFKSRPIAEKFIEENRDLLEKAKILLP